MTGSFSFPQAAARPMLEQSGDYTLPASQGGVIQKSAGSITTLDAYSAAQDSNAYGVKNGSAGDITIAAASGEWIQTATGNVSSLVLPSDYALQFIRNASNTANWIIQ